MTRLLLRFVTVLVGCTILWSCASQSITLDPRWGAKVYVGSIFDKGVVRMPAGEIIRYDSEEFTDLRCVHSEDVNRLFKILQECRQVREIYEADKLLE